MNEFSIISKYFSCVSPEYDGSLALKDDAAIITQKANENLIITKDAIVEDVHFFKDDKAYDIAQKLMGVNLSDLASMGATPLAYLLAVILPKNTSEKWLEDFSKGLKSSIKKYGGALIGGDTVTHKGPLTLTLTAIGQCPKGNELKRSNAQIDDSIFVTGTIGDSYLGLLGIKGKLKTDNFLQMRYHTPTPRIEMGINLRKVAHACIDISDGLIADLEHICESSNVGAKIYIDQIPTSSSAKKIISTNNGILIEMLNGGDDYELLFTCNKGSEDKIYNLSKKLGLQITKIGQITSGKKVIALDKNNNETTLQKRGYNHFE